MTLLKDDEIRKLIESRGVVRGVKLPLDYRPDSLLQPASFDFTVGKLYSPRAPDETRVSLILQQGGTAVVVTAEEFSMPADLGALTFPPSRLAFKGLLITNPGHIDPGFHGPMRFAIINMAYEEVELRVGDPVATVLFFKLTGPSIRPFSEGTDLAQYEAVTAEQVNRLSVDFLNFKKRASSIARREIQTLKDETTRSLTRWVLTLAGITTIPLLLVLISVLAQASWPFAVATKREVGDLRERIIRLETLADKGDTEASGTADLRQKGEPAPFSPETESR